MKYRNPFFYNSKIFNKFYRTNSILSARFQKYLIGPIGLIGPICPICPTNFNSGHRLLRKSVRALYMSSLMPPCLTNWSC